MHKLKKNSSKKWSFTITKKKMTTWRATLNASLFRKRDAQRLKAELLMNF